MPKQFPSSRPRSYSTDERLDRNLPFPQVIGLAAILSTDQRDHFVSPVVGRLVSVDHALSLFYKERNELAVAENQHERSVKENHLYAARDNSESAPHIRSKTRDARIQTNYHQ